VIAVAILVYVVLDGFDLGVDILFGTTRDAALREDMMAAISPFWDGNETWLIVIGASLFAAFPTVYAVFLSAFYIPVLLLLFGLIFRGVAFEFRIRDDARPLWNRGFFVGSLVVAFVQGAAVGAMIRGIPVVGVFAAVRRRHDAWPFALTVVFFVAAFLALAVMFWPYMIPYTIANAAALDASLSFLFWGAGVFVLPVIAIHTITVYWLFRGKLRRGYH
jgi:cytochrome bd-type quinol oxidase subunit 2